MNSSPNFAPTGNQTGASRFRHALSKYRIAITAECDNCGLCVELCPYGVYQKGIKTPQVAADYLCLGPSCQKNEFYCLARCPQDAIRLNPNPAFEVLGTSAGRRIC